MSDMIDRPLLHNARKSANVTLQQLATAVGVSVSTIRNWEFHKGDPTQVQREAIAERLGLAVDEIRWKTITPPEHHDSSHAQPGVYKTDRGRPYIVTDEGKVLW